MLPGLAETSVDNEALIRAKTAKLALLKEKATWIKEHRLYFRQERTAGQRAFHGSSAHTRMAYGMNRSGKTDAGVAEDISFALGFRPWQLPDVLKSKPIEWLLDHPEEIPDACKTPIKTPCKVLIIEDDWDTADGILISGTLDRAGKLTHYLPKGSVLSVEKNSLGYKYQWHLRNGSLIRIDTEKSFVNDPNSFEGDTWDLVHYDEPKRRDLRIALKRGLVDQYGYEIFTMTPLCEPWMKDELFDKAEKGDPEIHSFFFDNEELMSAGIVSREGWASFVASMTEDEKEARAHGKWIHLKGLVYPEFNARTYELKEWIEKKTGGHLIERPTDEWLYQHSTTTVSIDPHPRNPMACLFLASDVHGRWLCYDELYEKKLVPDFCSDIKVKLAVKIKNAKGELELRSQEVNLFLCDVLAFTEDPIDGKTWASEFHAQDIPVEKAPKRREAGILAVRQALKDGKLLIAKNCTRLIYELQHYVYQEWRYGQDHSAKEKPKDADDHLVECLYRIVLLEPRHYNKVLKSSAESVKGFNLCP